jgi:hypothetical protein
MMKESTVTQAQAVTPARALTLTMRPKWAQARSTPTVLAAAHPVATIRTRTKADRTTSPLKIRHRP